MPWLSEFEFSGKVSVNLDPPPIESSPSSTVSADSFSYASEELDAMAKAVNYYEWIWSHFSEYCGRDIIEIGAGIGTFSSLLLGWKPEIQIECIEPASNNYAVLGPRFLSDPRVRTRHSFLEPCVQGSKVDTIVAVNVMEHVADDREFLRITRERLRSGGRFLLFVPALPAIYGEMDRTYEHFRRYTKSGVRKLLSESGFEVEKIRYMNFLGVFTWWFYGRVLRRKSLNSRDAALYDRFAIPLLRRLESLWEPPLGQSVLAVATAP